MLTVICATERKLKQEISLSGEDEESDEESVPDEKPFKGAKQAGSSNGSLFGSNDEDENESESDFIVEDDGQVQLPAQFSMETHQDIQHQFKKIFQFFVHIAVQVPEDRKQFMEENLKSELASCLYQSNGDPQQRSRPGILLRPSADH